MIGARSLVPVLIDVVTALPYLAEKLPSLPSASKHKYTRLTSTDSVLVYFSGFNTADAVRLSLLTPVAEAFGVVCVRVLLQQYAKAT